MLTTALFLELDLGTDETVTAESKLKRSAWDILRRKIADEMSDINMLARCRNRFDLEFRYDDKGVPRVWKPGDDIDEAFFRAREATNRMFPLFKKIGMDIATINDLIGGEEPVEEANLVLLSDAKLDDVFSRVQRDLDISFTEAKRSVINTTAHVPPWMIMLMVFLGWNEAMALLSNPFYVFLLVLGGITFYVLTATGLWAPAKAIALQTSRQIGGQLSQTMEASGISLDGVVKTAKSLGEAAANASSSLLDSHRAAGGEVQMEPLNSNGARSGEKTPPPSAAARPDLRYRGPNTPGSFTESKSERTVETPSKYMGSRSNLE